MELMLYGVDVGVVLMLCGVDFGVELMLVWS